MPLSMSYAASRIIKVNILAVIGDKSLSSAAWMLGHSKYSPMGPYDSCIAVFGVNSSSFPSPNFPSSSSLGTFDPEKLIPIPIPPQTQTCILAIPSARVLSARSQWFASLPNPQVGKMA